MNSLFIKSYFALICVGFLGDGQYLHRETCQNLRDTVKCKPQIHVSPLTTEDRHCVSNVFVPDHPRKQRQT